MVSLLLSNRFPCLGDICRMLLYENHVWNILLYIKVFKSCCISIHFEWSHIVGYLLSLESACGIQMLTSNLDFLDRWEQGNSSSPTKNGLWHSPIREKKQSEGNPVQSYGLMMLSWFYWILASSLLQYFPMSMGFLRHMASLLFATSSDST